MTLLATATFLALDAIGVRQVVLGDTTIDWPWFTLAAFVVFAVFVYWHIWRLNRKIEQLTNARPNIELGESELHDARFQHQVLSGNAGEVFIYSSDPIKLCRIPIHNIGAPALAVTVRLINITPSPIALPNPILHRVGDNPKDWNSYQESFPLGRDELQFVDVISQVKQPPYTCHIWRVDFPRAVQAVQLSGDYIFTIGVYAGTFSRKQDYNVHVDAVSGILCMTTRPDGEHDRVC